MLRNWLSHADYQKYLLSVLPHFLSIERDRVLKLEGSISKLYPLNLDNVHPVIEKLYSNTGRPAKNQQGIIRSLVLMLDQKVYNFINRLWLSLLNRSKAYIKKLKPFKSKPRLKLKAGQKQPPKHSGVVAKLVKLAMKDRLPKNHPKRVFQQLLVRCVVDIMPPHCQDNFLAFLS